MDIQPWVERKESEDNFRMNFTRLHHLYPSTMMNVKRAFSTDSSFDYSLGRRYPMKENTIAVQNAAVSHSNVSSMYDMPVSLEETRLRGSINSSIKSLALSNCSGIYFGCVINNASTDNFRSESDHVSSSGFVDSDTDFENHRQGSRQGRDILSPKECPQDTYLQNVIDNTNLTWTNSKKDLFVETPAYTLSFHVLSRHGVVFITGNLGDGKTMTSRKLMEDMRKNNTILLELNAHSPANLETLVNGKRDTVVFLDDFLGKYCLDGRLLEMWTDRFPLMEEMVRAGNVQFILTIRKDILEEAKGSLKTLEFFREERIVDMTTCDLSKVKELILIRHVQTSPIFMLEHNVSTQLQKIIITSKEIKEISKIETPIGYPLSCYLYTSKSSFACQGKIFFHKPVIYIKCEIECMERKDKNRYGVLAVVLLCGGRVSHYDISSFSEMFRSSLSKVSETCEIQLQRATFIRIAKSLASSHTFLRSTDNGDFMFSHDAIKEATALAYCTKGLKYIIEMCPLSFLLEMVVINSSHPPGLINNHERIENGSKIELSILDFDLLINRFLHEILARNVWEVSHHTAFLDSIFLGRFFTIIQESPKIKEAITARHNVDIVGDLLFYAANNELPRVELLERLLTFYLENRPRKGKHARFKLGCFSVRQRRTDHLEYAMTNALHIACMFGHKDICDILFRCNARETPTLLCTAMLSQNVEIIQSLLQKYKWSEEQKQLALLKACNKGNIELYDLMVQSLKTKWGDEIFSKCLLESAKSGNVDLFDKIVTKGCDVNYRGCFERCALHEACIGGHESLIMRLLKVPNIDIYATDRQGYTALDYAVEYNLDNIVKLLMNSVTELKVSVRKVWFGLRFDVTAKQT